MTAIQLYRYINENAIEWKWTDDDVLIFPFTFQVGQFQEMLSAGHFDDGGIECIMKKDCFCIEMKYICEYYGIELEEIFPKNQ